MCGVRPAVVLLVVIGFLLAGWSDTRAASVAPALANRPQFRVTLRAESHTAVAGVRWRFVVRAVDLRGRPAGGTAVVQALVRGRVVDTVGWFGFHGTLRRTYRWSRKLRSSTAVFRAKVIGEGGTRTVKWPVRVRSRRATSGGHPQFRAMLRVASRRPVAGATWWFAVRAVDARGRPAGGTAVVQVLARGRVVDTVGWFGFDGRLRRTYRWSRALRGASAILQAKVIGPGGYRTHRYRLRVR
jgi:hypothetical protein